MSTPATPLWEVFIRARRGLNHVHAGSLHAADAETALRNARDVFTRRNEGVSIWVVPSAAITASSPDERDAFFDPAGDTYQVSLPIAIAIAATFVVLIGFALAKALKARRAKPKTGQEELLGETGTVRDVLSPEGLVFVHGEIWRARSSTGETIAAGTPVRVSTMAEGLVLEVEPTEELAVVP